MRRIIKGRAYGLLVAALAIIAFVFLMPVNAYAVSDHTGPVIKSLTADKTDVTVGDMVTFTMKVRDASGVSDKSSDNYIGLKNENGKYEYVDFDKIDETTFKGTLKITDNFVDGDYQLAYIYSKDIYGNETLEDSYDLTIHVSGAVSDNKGPVIKSLSADKTDVTVGDMVTFTMKVRDASGVSDKSSDNYIGLKNENGKYEYVDFDKIDETTFKGTLKITDNFVDGDYQLAYIYSKDIYGNETLEDSYDLTIHVSGAVSDNKGPVIKSLSADKTDVTVGDMVTFTMKVRDASGVSDKPSENFIGLKNENGKYEYVDFDKIDETTFKGTLKITDNFVDGDYQLAYIYSKDIYGNETLEDSYDLTIHVIPKELLDNTKDIRPLENIKVVNSNTTLTNVTVNGDLYIAPDSIATLNNVTVTGNIYVLGTLRANSIQAKAIYMKSMTVGGIAYGNGAASLSGSCSVETASARSSVITEVPHRIDSDLVSVDGKLSIKGAYANIATMYVNDKKVNATTSGKFYLNDIDVGNADSITVKFVTATGETFTKKYHIERGTKDSDGNVNIYPTITAKDISVCEGTDLNVLDGVTANDKEDGNITSHISVSPKTISTNKVGLYKVVYSVTDSKGAQATKEITVEVKAHKYSDWKTTKEATCTKEGTEERTCSVCGKKETRSINPLGHDYSTSWSKDSKQHWHVCKRCGEKSDVAAHSFSDWQTTKKPTCTEEGIKERVCSICGHKESQSIKALGHDYDTRWKTDDKRHWHVCKRCGKKDKEDAAHTFSEWKTVEQATKQKPGKKERVCTVCGYPETQAINFTYGKSTRIYGATRYQTAINTANELKKKMGGGKFGAAIIAYGENYPDALSGTYLANVKKAPLLLANAKDSNTETNTVNYVKNNVSAGGKVYLLGGSGLVSANLESTLKKQGYSVARLYGSDRYQTNIEILKEAGVKNGQDLLVCTGENYPDALSTSALGKPILLIGRQSQLTSAQRTIIQGKNVYIIGGTAAISDRTKNSISRNAKRINGIDRYDTSAKIAKQFCKNPTTAVLAYGQNFPDGLAGGTLAYKVNAPLLLATSNSAGNQSIANYVDSTQINSLYVLGGPGLISDNAAQSVLRYDK